MQVLEDWELDDSIIWRATVQHHPLFGKWYIDYSHLVDNYLPLLMQNKFDLYLNGHEHTLDHAYYPYSQIETDP